MNFERKRLPRLIGTGTDLHHVLKDHLDQGHHSPFSVVASDQGVKIQGDCPWIANRLQLDDLALVIAQAWRDHLRMKPRIEVVQGPQMDLPLPEHHRV